MKITDLVPWRRPGRELATRNAAIDPVRGLQLDVDRAFDQFWRMTQNPFAAFGPLAQAEAVRVDVEDAGTEIRLTAELPGMSGEEVEVSVRDGLLTIRGEKKSEGEAKENGILVNERVYGAIERAVSLPEGVDADAASATFSNGVLKVVIPKSPELLAGTKRIHVQTD